MCLRRSIAVDQGYSCRNVEAEKKRVEQYLNINHIHIHLHALRIHLQPNCKVKMAQAHGPNRDKIVPVSTK